MTKALVVEWLEEDAQHTLWVAGETGPIEVRVVQAMPPYLRTVADNTYTDNLLALPRF